jgi:hypothetical protein
MVAILKAVFDDGLPTVKLPDISGGLNTMEGILSLPSNQTPMCANVIGFPGRTLYAGGYSLYTQNTVNTSGADASWEFFDVNNAKHIIEWRGGQMFDTVNGVLVTVSGATYTAGQDIGHVDENGVLYWCTASVPLQAYNGSTNTAVVSSGSAGSVAIPTGTYLCAYAGSIVVANPGISGSANPGSFIPSNVNDPTTFIGANLTATGSNNYIEAMVPMGVAAGGVPPTNSIMVLGSKYVILAQGPVNSLKLNSVNVPVGCLDGNSVVYVPTGDLLGSVVFMGTDTQFWWTNGITAEWISKQILDYVNINVQDAYNYNPNQRFFAAYNGRYQYYICDLGVGGGQQLIYRWQSKAWYVVQGWPSGAYLTGTTGIGFPCNYVASADANTPGMYIVGQDNINFNGTNPQIFFNTPYLHANDPSLDKEWQYITLEMNNIIPAAYQVYAQSQPRANGSVLKSNTLTFMNPTLANAMASNYGIWDVSKWDSGALWAPGLAHGTLTNPTETPYQAAGMLSVPVPKSVWVPYNTTQPLRSPAALFNISWTANGLTNAIPTFDILGFQTRYKPMGHATTGGATYAAESGASGSSYPFT